MKKALMLLATALLLFVGAVFTIPLLIHGGYLGNEASAVVTMGDLDTAEQLFRDKHLRFGSLQELAEANLIDADLADGQHKGYTYSLQVSAVHSDSRWIAVANPIERGETGLRAFAINHKGELHQTTAGPLDTTQKCVLPRGVTPNR